MSLLNRLLGKQAAKQFQCDYCGRKLIPERSIDGANPDFHLIFMEQVGLRCPNCRKTACHPCVWIGSKRRGAKDYVCPNCGTDISRGCYR